MNINLIIKERLAALAILNSFKGSLETMKVVLDDVRKFTVTPEDWASVDKKEMADGANVRWEWDDEKDTGKDIELHEDTAKYLRDEIDKKSAAKEFGISDGAYLTLREKLTV